MDVLLNSGAVRFPSGLPQHLHSKEEGDIDFCVYRNAGNPEKQAQRIIKIESDGTRFSENDFIFILLCGANCDLLAAAGVEYSGRNFGAKANPKNALRRYTSLQFFTAIHICVV
jgi:hypothetical protein